MKPIDLCIKRCFLCDEINNNNSLSACLDFYKSPEEKIMAESTHFIAFPDISPIVPGHSLLLTKSHILSYAQLPKDYWSELKEIKNYIKERIENKYGPAFIFEHGSTQSDIESGICIQHAHLHIIPAKLHIVDSLKVYSHFIDYKQIDIQEALNDMRTTYIYYENSDGFGCVINPIRSLPQQFIRRVVAQKYHLPDWDWKQIASPYLI